MKVAFACVENSCRSQMAEDMAELDSVKNTGFWFGAPEF